MYGYKKYYKIVRSLHDRHHVMNGNDRTLSSCPAKKDLQKVQ